MKIFIELGHQDLIKSLTLTINVDCDSKSMQPDLVSRDKQIKINRVAKKEPSSMIVKPNLINKEIGQAPKITTTNKNYLEIAKFDNG